MIVYNDKAYFIYNSFKRDFKSFKKDIQSLQLI